MPQASRRRRKLLPSRRAIRRRSPGLRGQHPGSFEIAHAHALEGNRFAFEGLPVEEATISSSSAAASAGWPPPGSTGAPDPQARILILDNHDDFGGHAKRNEFTLDGRLIIGYGGSESMHSPKTLYSDVAKGLLRELGVDIARFETAFDRKLYSSLGLVARRVLCRARHSAATCWSPATAWPRRATTSRASCATPSRSREFVAAFPISAGEQGAAASRSTIGARDPLAGKTVEEKLDILKTHELPRLSDQDLRLQRGGRELLPGPHARLLRARLRRGAGGRRARTRLSGLRRARPAGDAAPGRDEPYIYHFPDGNASLARLLVRALVPGVAPGDTMDDIVLAPFDYGSSTAPASRCASASTATCIDVRNAGEARSSSAMCARA